MAFNISITKKGTVDWVELHQIAESLKRYYVTVYPIEKTKFLNESGIGLSIILRDSYSGFWKDFELFMNKVVAKGFTITELYNGTNISPQKIQQLKDLLK